MRLLSHFTDNETEALNTILWKTTVNVFVYECLRKLWKDALQAVNISYLSWGGMHKQKQKQ